MEFFYRCSECDRQFAITPDLMLCPDCSQRHEPDQPLRGVLEVGLRGELRGPWPPPGAEAPSLPYAELLPVEPRYFPVVPVGNTPLWEPARLRQHLGRPGIYLKDDTANPTGSLKDRASLLVAAFARKHEISDVVVASTGNAASSMAGIGAAAGLSVRIFVPKSVPRAKLVQSLQYGAEVTVVDGTYDDACRDSLEYTALHGGLSRNTGFNPLTIEGKKTVALEVFAQLGRMPDAVFVPTGDGVILGGVFKGFEDLIRLGLADTMPTIYAVQAEGSNAICRALARGEFDDPVPGNTIADSISVGVPANGRSAVKKLARHGGHCVEVSDAEILDAQQMLSSQSGLFAEPAAASSVAGLLRVSDTLPRDAVTVLLITGTGLKDIEAATDRVGIPG
ncbi:MAG: threonine synthase [Spirochaetales bacterium]|nr:threonine synthase [Spirochaetales bacterium]